MSYTAQLSQALYRSQMSSFNSVCVRVWPANSHGQLLLAFTCSPITEARTISKETFSKISPPLATENIALDF